jgi:hypothetical protein
MLGGKMAEFAAAHDETALVLYAERRQNIPKSIEFRS